MEIINLYYMTMKCCFMRLRSVKKKMRLRGGKRASCEIQKWELKSDINDEFVFCMSRPQHDPKKSCI